MTPRRVILGTPPAASGGVAHLAFQAKKLARQMGFSAWLEFSRSRESATRYLRVALPGRGVGYGFPLKIRITDHELARPTGCDFELVSKDGLQGAEAISAFLHAVATGEVV